MATEDGHWAAVSRDYVKDLKLVTEAALSGDDSRYTSGSVAEAAGRLETLLAVLPQMDETEGQDSASIREILLYIGWRAAKVSARLPLTLRPRDIKVPARDILDLIEGEKTLDQVLAEAEENL